MVVVINIVLIVASILLLLVVLGESHLRYWQRRRERAWKRYQEANRKLLAEIERARKLL